MKKVLMMLAVLFTAVAMQAQEDVFSKYSEMGDINTLTVGKASLEKLPVEQFDVPGLKEMIDRIDMMTVLVSMGDKAGKKLGTKLPGQLQGKGFVTKLDTKQDGKDVTVMQSKKDPSRVVVLVYQKPKAVAVYMKGDFSDVDLEQYGRIAN